MANERAAAETAVTKIRAALYRGERTAAEQLVAAGEPVNVFDAAALGDVERLRAAIDAEAAVVAEWSADGFTALHFAAFLGGTEAVRVLVDAGSDVGAVARNEMKVQPLHSAAANGNVESCRILLAAGADPNAKQQGDFTPMNAAVRENNEELVELLRSYGA